MGGPALPLEALLCGCGLPDDIERRRAEGQAEAVVLRSTRFDLREKPPKPGANLYSTSTKLSSSVDTLLLAHLARWCSIFCSLNRALVSLAFIKRLVEL